MKHTTRIIMTTLAASTALVLGACTTTGMGGGELTRKGQPEEPVMFSWKSTDGGISGSMVATLPDATYQGRFFQITQSTERQSIEPLWVGWSVGWNDWPYWGPAGYGVYDSTQFITRYTGKVVASLQTDAGKRMRCRLHLLQPTRGMAGGGEGECQIQGSGTVQARF